MPESDMIDDELIAYLRDQFNEPTMEVVPFEPGYYRIAVTAPPEDEHYMHCEYAYGLTPRGAMMDCISRHGAMMKRERER